MVFEYVDELKEENPGPPLVEDPVKMSNHLWEKLALILMGTLIALIGHWLTIGRTLVTRNEVMQLINNSAAIVTRAEVQQLIEHNTPYVRDRGELYRMVGNNTKAIDKLGSQLIELSRIIERTNVLLDRMDKEGRSGAR